MKQIPFDRHDRKYGLPVLYPPFNYTGGRSRKFRLSDVELWLRLENREIGLSLGENKLARKARFQNTSESGANTYRYHTLVALS